MTRAVERRAPNPTAANIRFLKAHGTSAALAIANDMMHDGLASLESIISRSITGAVSDIWGELRHGFRELRVSLA